MSWDLLVYDFQGDPPPVEDWDADDGVAPLGSPKEVRARIDAQIAGVDWSDPTHGIFEGDGFTIEFALGSEKVLETFMLHVRGGGEAVAALLQIAEPNRWSLYDCSTDEWIDPKDPSNAGWEDFQAFRDRAFGNASSKTAKKAPAKKSSGKKVAKKKTPAKAPKKKVGKKK